MQFGIVSDSSCDLPEAYLQAEQVQIVSFYISFDGENYYQEGKQISIPDFYQKMADNRTAFQRHPCHLFRTMWMHLSHLSKTECRYYVSVFPRS